MVQPALRVWWRAACGLRRYDLRRQLAAGGPGVRARSVYRPANLAGQDRAGRGPARWWTALCSCRRSDFQLLGLNRRTARFAGDGAWGWPGSPAPSVGRGAVVVATVDSLYRVLAADGEVTHRVRSPGTIVSPWLVHRGLLVAGTTDSQVVAISPADLKTRWSARWTPPFSGPGGAGRYVNVASRRGTLPSRPGNLPVPGRVIELDWPSRPLTAVDGELLLGGADGILQALRSEWHRSVAHPALESGRAESGRAG